ncbi:DUF7684 family protein [Noviherbaspirillum sp.]|uniref:DUF7684 family protein n=1 Tax=Noviherbaspirillum sp. TaxID=1926288 RepID=UPI002FDFD4AD
MLKTSVTYLHMKPDEALPAIDTLSPFKAILLIETDVPQMWQWEVSRWLVSSRCRHMMAWGKECGSWAESVEEASLEAFNYEDVPEDQSVITTAHDDDEASEVFWFAKHRAHHPVHGLRNVVILHIADVGRKEELERLFEDA